MLYKFTVFPAAYSFFDTNWYELLSVLQSPDAVSNEKFLGIDILEIPNDISIPQYVTFRFFLMRLRTASTFSWVTAVFSQPALDHCLGSPVYFSIRHINKKLSTDVWCFIVVNRNQLNETLLA